MSWFRCRFDADLDDCRPVKFPPPGPFWRSGQGDGYSIVVAYVKHSDEIREYWPEAENVDAHPCETITFSDRFPRPEWWKGEP
jgi:hypothetical protein